MAKFEDDLAELERVVEQIERGELSLEENVDLYEKGVLLSRACKAVLQRSEARIEALVDPEDDGPVRVAAVDVPEDDDGEDKEEDRENAFFLDDDEEDTQE
jgi:exodeoxyribonuclease VII small subunit